MTISLGQFQTPEDISAPGLDGRAIRFRCLLIDAQKIGTPQQTSETKEIRITVEISDSLIVLSNLKGSDLIKVLFQIAKEHFQKVLKNTPPIERDIKVIVNTYTHKGPCPYDREFIEEPNGATVQIELNRPIGFIWDA